jgi:HK97 family phage portal protein
MGLRDRLFGDGEGILRNVIEGAEYRTGLANPEGWFVDSLGGSRSVSGQRVTVNTALGVSSVFSAVTMISEAVGRMPLKVYRMIDDDDREEARTHRAWSMLHDKPNPVMPANRFWSTVTAHLLLHGNAFCPLIRSPISGLVESLALEDPQRMTVEWNDVAMTKRYKRDAGMAGQKTYDESEMLHVIAFSLDGVIGQSRIHWARNALGNAIARDKFEGGFYDRGAVLSGVIEHPDELSPAAQTKLEATWRARWSGADRAHGTPVLEEGATFKPLSMPLSDMQFVENAQLSRTDIAVLFQLPPNYLGGSSGDSLTYATVESNQIQFVQHAVMPYTDTISRAVSSDTGIFPQQNTYYAEFVTDALLRADAVARGDFYTKLASLKAITVNEIRARENMPPLEGGDEMGSATPEQARETIQDPAAATQGTTVTPDTSTAIGTNGNGNGKPAVPIAP